MTADAETYRSAVALCDMLARSPIRGRFNSMRIMRFDAGLAGLGKSQVDVVIAGSIASWARHSLSKDCFGKARAWMDGSTANELGPTVGVYVERAGPSNAVRVYEYQPPKDDDLKGPPTEAGVNTSEKRADRTTGEGTPKLNGYIDHSSDWERVARDLAIFAFEIPAEDVLGVSLALNPIPLEVRCFADSSSCVRVGERAELELHVRKTLWSKPGEVRVRWRTRCTEKPPLVRQSKRETGNVAKFTASFRFPREDVCEVQAVVERGEKSLVKSLPLESKVGSALVWGGIAYDRVSTTYRERRWVPFVTPSVTSGKVVDDIFTGIGIIPGEQVRDLGRATAARLEAIRISDSEKLNGRAKALIARKLEAWGDLLGYRILSDHRLNLPLNREPTLSDPGEMFQVKRLDLCASLHASLVEGLEAEGLVTRTISVFEADETQRWLEACQEIVGRPRPVVPRTLSFAAADSRGLASYHVLKSIQNSPGLATTDLDLSDPYPERTMRVEKVRLQGTDSDERLSTPVALDVKVAPREASLGLRAGYVTGTQTTDDGNNRWREGGAFGITLRALDQMIELDAEAVINQMSETEASVHGARARFGTGILWNVDCVMQLDSGLCPPIVFGVGGGYEWIDGAPYVRLRTGVRIRTPTIVQFIPQIVGTGYYRPGLGISSTFLFGFDMLAL